MLISFCFFRSEIDVICSLVFFLYTDYNFIITCFSNKHVERVIHQQCVEEFELAALQNDDNITPDLMIKCCDRLLRHNTVVSITEGSPSVGNKLSFSSVRWRDVCSVQLEAVNNSN